MSANTNNRRNPMGSGKNHSAPMGQRRKGNPYQRKERPIHAVANLGTVADKFFKKKYFADQRLSVVFSGDGDAVTAVFNFTPYSTDGLRLESPLALSYPDYVQYLSAREAAIKTSNSQQGWNNLVGKIHTRLRLRTEGLQPSSVNYHRSMTILLSFFTQKERELLNATQSMFASFDPIKVSSFLRKSLEDSGLDWPTRVAGFNAVMEGRGELPKFSIVSYDRKSFLSGLKYDQPSNPGVKKTSGPTVASAVQIADAPSGISSPGVPIEGPHASGLSGATPPSDGVDLTAPLNWADSDGGASGLEVPSKAANLVSGKNQKSVLNRMGLKSSSKGAAKT